MITEGSAARAMVVAPCGRLDAAATSDLEGRLEDIISGQHPFVVLNLKDATYVCSSCLRVLFLSLRKLRARGGDLVLCSPSPRIKFILQVSGFDRIFNIADTQEAAQRLLTDCDERGCTR